jgi:ribosomal protein S21
MRKPVIKVENDKSQGPTVVMRYFSKKVSGSGILRTARAGRYHTRSQSELSKKNGAIKRIGKRKERERLIKLGKAVPMKGKRR